MVHVKGPIHCYDDLKSLHYVFCTDDEMREKKTADHARNTEKIQREREIGKYCSEL